MFEKFRVFTDIADGFARRYCCDDIDGLYFVVLYHGIKSVYGVACGDVNKLRSFARQHGGITYDVFDDVEKGCEYFYAPYLNSLVRFSADNFEDVSITAV